MESSKSHRIRTIDWLTLIPYMLLVVFGWLSIYAASYDFENTLSIFNLQGRAGKQLLWIGVSLFMGVLIIFSDYKKYETYGYPIYWGMMIVLLLTIFIAPDIKGSRSWLVVGPISIQPAEFAKVATALAMGKYLNSYGFTFKRSQQYIPLFGLIALPFLLILLQKETGSALVFSSFLILFYREGMSGKVIFTLTYTVAIFILSIKYDQESIGQIPMNQFIILYLILIIEKIILFTSLKDKWLNKATSIFLVGLPLALMVLYWTNTSLPLHYIGWGWIGISVLYSLIKLLIRWNYGYFWIIVISFYSIGAMFSVNYLFDQVLQPHQQTRIMVSLGLADDPTGAGYNVNQSLIAIGSGGLSGKGFLQGTQTRLKYVPEQDTDFIFCTIGEELGFVGSSIALLLYGFLLYRIITIAERGADTFVRVYGYAVAGILFFHLFINVGMVLGMLPVIGIPLPFFSYGGSSILAFSILLFILIRLDASRFYRY